MKNFISVITLIVAIFSLPCNSQVGINQKPNAAVQKPGQFYSQDIFISGEDNVFEYRIPSFITTTKGTLIAVCDARVDKPGDAPNNIDLAMRRSTDGGKTWSKTRIIVDFPGDDAAADPSMVVDQLSGTIWLAYDYAYADPQGNLGRIIRIHLIKSDDDGITWSSPVDISYLTKGKNFWLQNGPGGGLYSDGVIIFPMYSAMRPTAAQALAATPDLKGTQQSMLVYSEDHGKTWSLSNGVGDINSETQLANLSGGRIMANMRRPRGHGFRQVSITDDLGKTWSEVYDDSTLIEPGCQASLINYNYKGKSFLVFSNPADKKERKNLVVRVSYDEGKSWPKELSIYNSYGGSARYSCLTQLPNGNIGLIYEADLNYKLIDNKKRFYGEKIVFVEIPYQELF
jgi:sialidase-1